MGFPQSTTNCSIVQNTPQFFAGQCRVLRLCEMYNGAPQQRGAGVTRLSYVSRGRRLRRRRRAKLRITLLPRILPSRRLKSSVKGD